MPQNWNKKGLLYNCKGIHPKLMTHAANPLPVHLKGNIYRVFFSSRDNQQRSSVGAVDIDIVDKKVLIEHQEPFFVHGPEGSFYSHGVSIGNLYNVDGVNYIGFMGWQNPEDGHWFGEIGRLVVNDDTTLSMDSKSQTLRLDDHDPISLSYPWVLKDSNKYKMWYGSTIEWDAGNNEMLHVIKYAESCDGHNWVKSSYYVPYKLGFYQAFSRPTVIKGSAGFRMWFSYRSGTGETYRIGSTDSLDGLTWNNEIVLNALKLSPSGWDSEMVEYPYVMTHNEITYMFYNGNEYGKSGFGLAILEE